MGEVFIYDSLINLNVKGDKISFPIRVEQTTCQLLRTNLDFIDMRVVDVQQHRGGRDCGLFAIVFAVALCLGKDPIQGVIKQIMLRKALTDCFEQRDISTLLDAVSFKPNPSNTDMILYQCVCKVLCHCRMPDDGELMVPCSSCKQWYHGSCESGDFLDPRWICIKCNKKRKLAELQQAKTRKEEDKRKKSFQPYAKRQRTTHHKILFIFTTVLIKRFLKVHYQMENNLLEQWKMKTTQEYQKQSPKIYLELQCTTKVLIICSS